MDGGFFLGLNSTVTVSITFPSSFHIVVEHSTEDINGIGPKCLREKKGTKKGETSLALYHFAWNEEV